MEETRNAYKCLTETFMEKYILGQDIDERIMEANTVKANNAYKFLKMSLK
jgi:hypothetical protein